MEDSNWFPDDYFSFIYPDSDEEDQDNIHYASLEDFLHYLGSALEEEYDPSDDDTTSTEYYSAYESDYDADEDQPMDDESQFYTDDEDNYSSADSDKMPFIDQYFTNEAAQGQEIILSPLNNEECDNCEGQNIDSNDDWMS